MKTHVRNLLQHRVISAMGRVGTKYRGVINRVKGSTKGERIKLEGLGMQQGSVALSMSSEASLVPLTGMRRYHGLRIPMHG